ncbi:hypothetical protein AH70_05610 [Pediococcus damnosus LMG 28219]|nr:hypothetical protein AH70_05610 [Pediococcus damnosus LMG 28219]PIO81309.1 hypothetical protein BSQ38_06425 [Pediococcus damnosus]PIO85147.1 hypothetical protein BSQ37_04030 [Pediococcus damnosus]PJE49163.1 hypothetical protein BSQ36_04075 [Pediococcus damnosus]
MKKLFSTNSNRNILLRNFILGLSVAVVCALITLFEHSFSISDVFLIFVDLFVLLSVGDFARNKTNNKFIQVLLVLLAGVIIMISIFISAIIFHF